MKRELGTFPFNRKTRKIPWTEQVIMTFLKKIFTERLFIIRIRKRQLKSLVQVTRREGLEYATLASADYRDQGRS